MTEYERHMPQHDHHDKDRGAMVRTILQGLILAGIVGLVGMVIQQGKDQAAADAAKSVQIATLQTQIATLQNSLAGLPDLSNRVMRLETNQAELMRRQNIIDAWRDRMQDNNGKVKGWTR